MNSIQKKVFGSLFCCPAHSTHWEEENNLSHYIFTTLPAISALLFLFPSTRRILTSLRVALVQGVSIMASMQKRLQKELMALQNDPPPGMTLNEKSVQNTITQWIVDMEGATGTLYEGEKFQLLFKFSGRYPFDSPQVMFMGENIPVHPHVYSNGHICLSILTEDWSPALSVQSVCLSIISMLSSCKEKRRPPDNSFYVKTCNKNPKKTKWWYHDDTC
ncbi:probable ubiquitin-conjugating enzyme E2 W-B isoform X1 [Salmo salar]|uniref:Probable ubiquitin-conjugating enzyme E2 W-B isoform X1 n=2 Tax=Salmo salar TaxID=8030 RepID=A0ABM3DJ15_SALSA|nr:probable ubiquitin-conjugating enzyme E2 W-B isoform X1 [Salmo salar]